MNKRVVTLYPPHSIRNVAKRSIKLSRFCSNKAGIAIFKASQRHIVAKAQVHDTIHKEQVVRGIDDTQTGVLPGIPGSAMCVQKLDDSRAFASHISYRILLRSSSLQEPRDPLLKVITIY